MIRKTGSANWQGGLREGSGTVSTQTGVLDSRPYGFNTRFQGERGTNPEELLGAAHAACFSMALSDTLEEHDLTAANIDTTATVTLEPDSLTITGIHLEVSARVPNASEDQFESATQAAKRNCPVSKLFSGSAEITMDAKLV